MLSQLGLKGRSGILSSVYAGALTTKSARLVVCRRGSLRCPASSATDALPGNRGTKLASFLDHRIIYEHRPTEELLASLVILQASTNPVLAQHGARLLRGTASPPVAVLSRLLHDTLFRQFCLDPAPLEVWTRMNVFSANGIGAIVENVEGGTGSLAESRGSTHEAYTKAVLTSVSTAAAQPGQAFAIAKLSSLGDPEVLLQLSAAVSRLYGAFEAYDDDRDGMILHEEFEECVERLTGGDGTPGVSFDAGEDDDEDMCQVDFEAEGENTACQVDYVSWVRRLHLRDLLALAAKLQQQQQQQQQPREQQHQGTNFQGVGASPLPLLQERLDGMLGRLGRLVDHSLAEGVKLILDVEPGPLQPALEHIGLHLMRKHSSASPSSPAAANASSTGDNRNSTNGSKGRTVSGDGMAGSSGEAPSAGAQVYITYTAGLPGVRQHLEVEVARAQRLGYVVGLRLTSGDSCPGAEGGDGETAADCSATSSDRDVEECQATYNACLEEVLLPAVLAGHCEVVVATAAEPCVEAAVRTMGRLGLDPGAASVYFCQPLGLADHLSFALGSQGYRVYKQLPVGSASSKVAPYLARLLQELPQCGAASQDLSLLRAELWRRLVAEPLQQAASRMGGGTTGRRGEGSPPPQSAAAVTACGTPPPRAPPGCPSCGACGQRGTSMDSRYG